MNRFTEFLKEIKELFDERDRSVRIRNFLYEQLLTQASHNEREVDLIVNQILAEKFEQLEEEARQRQEDEIHERELIEYYVSLDKYLYATINRNIEIGITNRLVGREPSYCNYTLIDYKLSKKYQFLEFQLERNNERYPIAFEHINDIKFLYAGETLKTWIYMQNPIPTWRFYLDYDKNLIEQDIKTGRLEL